MVARMGEEISLRGWSVCFFLYPASHFFGHVNSWLFIGCLGRQCFANFGVVLMSRLTKTPYPTSWLISGFHIAIVDMIEWIIWWSHVWKCWAENCLNPRKGRERERERESQSWNYDQMFINLYNVCCKACQKLFHHPPCFVLILDDFGLSLGSTPMFANRESQTFCQAATNF